VRPRTRSTRRRPVRPRTRSTRRRQKQLILSQREVTEITDSSSEGECDHTSIPYREYVERLLKRREVSNRVSEHSQYEDVIEPNTMQSAEELESNMEDDEEGQVVTDSDPYDSGTDLDAGRSSVYAPKEKLSSRTKVNRVPRPRITEKRPIKPVF